MGANKSDKTKRIKLYLIITVLLSVGVVCAESIPNHSMKNGGEYSLWLTISVFPIVFALYGIFSGVMLGKQHRALFFVIYPFWLLVLFFLQRFLYVKMGSQDSLISAFSGMILYSVCIFAGYTFYVIVSKIILLLFYRESKNKEVI